MIKEKINVENLYNRILLGGNGLDFERIHISIPKELLKLLNDKYPNGTRSRLIALAIAEKLKKQEKQEYDNLRKNLHSNFIKRTDWQGVYKSFEDYPK